MAAAIKAQRAEVETVLRMALELLDAAEPDVRLLAAAPHITRAIEILNPHHFDTASVQDPPIPEASFE